MTASISPVLVQLLPCGPQMRLYVHETGGKALTNYPSKPGGRVGKFVPVFSAGALTVLVRMWKGVMKCVGVQYGFVCACVSCEGWRREQTGPPQFSLSIILHTRHTSSDMPERVSISCVCVFVCLCCSVYPRNAVHYICMCVCLITYTLCTHANQGRWSLKARAMLSFHLLKTHSKLEQSGWIMCLFLTWNSEFEHFCPD